MSRLRGKALRLEPQIRGRSIQFGTASSATANKVLSLPDEGIKIGAWEKERLRYAQLDAGFNML